MSRFHYVSLAIALSAAMAIWLTDGAVQTTLLILLGLVWVAAFTLGVALINLEYFGPALCRGSTGDKRCALTFDDGPDIAATPPLLDLLREQNVPAAFFCIGVRALQSPALAARIVREGHLVGNHAHHHGWWTNLLPARWLAREIRLCQAALDSCTGTMPTMYRPPIGLTNPALPGTLRRLGLPCVGWSIRSLDRLPLRTDQIVERIRQRLSDGSIILLHDGGADPERLLAIVSAVIAHARSEGYNFVRLDELFCDPGGRPA